MFGAWGAVLLVSVLLSVPYLSYLLIRTISEPFKDTDMFEIRISRASSPMLGTTITLPGLKPVVVLSANLRSFPQMVARAIIAHEIGHVISPRSKITTAFGIAVIVLAGVGFLLENVFITLSSVALITLLFFLKRREEFRADEIAVSIVGVDTLICAYTFLLTLSEFYRLNHPVKARLLRFIARVTANPLPEERILKLVEKSGVRDFECPSEYFFCCGDAGGYPGPDLEGDGNADGGEDYDHHDGEIPEH